MYLFKRGGIHELFGMVLFCQLTILKVHLKWQEMYQDIVFVIIILYYIS